MAQQIVVDPITRIEGHLRIECEVDDGQITNARSIGTMWRGIENILKGRDPREAWIIAQRICGVCTTVHGLASVRAVENALNLEIPVNAQLIRNLIVGAHCIADNMIHFYILSAVDWADIASAALKADPVAASQLAQQLSPWKHNSAQEFAQVQARLKKLIESGQLGPFASGYWGHPAFHLEPNVNLIAAVHYFQALDHQRKINKIVSILGSKTPHIQNLAVGGVANAINLDSPATLTMDKLYYIKTQMDEVRDFISQVYTVDVAAIAAFYPEWCQLGKAQDGNFLSVPEMPQDGKSTRYTMPGGYIHGGNLGALEQIADAHDPLFEKNVQECVKHAFYKGDWTRSPYDSDTEPDYNPGGEKGKYSWVKAPSFRDEPAQVGPVAHVLAMYAARYEPAVQAVKRMLDRIAGLAKAPQSIDILPSTMGRHISRAIRTDIMKDVLADQWTALITNIGNGDYATCNTPVFPKGEIQGVGFHEAPRGALSHWVVIANGKIRNYQAVVPSTWVAGPRDAKGELGYYEKCLVGNPIADPEKPLEVLRTVHSFDPCLACAVHLIDGQRVPLGQVRVL